MTSALGGRVGVAKNMTKYDEGEGGEKWNSDVIFGGQKNHLHPYQGAISK